jgi:hypothetical protein
MRNTEEDRSRQARPHGIVGSDLSVSVKRPSRFKRLKTLTYRSDDFPADLTPRCIDLRGIRAEVGL